MKKKILALLETNQQGLSDLYSKIKKLSSANITKAQYQNSAKQLCRDWFDKIIPQLKRLKFKEEETKEITDHFSQLLNYSKKASRRTSYLASLEAIQKIHNELIHEIEISTFESSSGLNISPYLENLSEDEKSYLKEAEICAQNNCIRASILLGWCATVDRLHQKIQALGFDNFNKASNEMKAKTFGRYKRFKKSYAISSLSELREVFDTDILWVIEYLELIDGNQHERLRHCFLLRNNSGHPGEAPITGENLYSFYSDITKIVLKNTAFDY